MLSAVSTKERWLDEGLATLARLGTPGLRIDRLARQLGLSKGSFYHHFDGMPGYKRELLAHFERECTTRYIDLVEQEDALDARAKLGLLADLVLADTDAENIALEVAVRSWAWQDDGVRAAQQRVDDVRTDYLVALCEGAGADRKTARDVARTIYLLLIGAGHVIPPAPNKELRRLWALAMDLLPQTAKSIPRRRR